MAAQPGIPIVEEHHDAPTLLRLFSPAADVPSLKIKCMGEFYLYAWTQDEWQNLNPHERIHLASRTYRLPSGIRITLCPAEDG